ncbi:hypothetical protein Ssi02_21260 [Sinosporangium siamense]|uniref:Peptidase S8/S53 domain-containing protein n=1 Tax=Sinosporangium siamense TaxID=1367973 RepID=A0A919RFL3_9ACTN|nr:hypothetical protein Ssi02_21260 [Sinosporangium siamense]
MLIVSQAPALAGSSALSPDKIHKSVHADLAGDGKAAFWVRLNNSADLSSAKRAVTKTDKARLVYEAKTTHAESSQAELRKLLTAAGAEFTPYWVVNAVQVKGGDRALADTIAKLPQVLGIDPVETVEFPADAAPPAAKPKPEAEAEYKAETKREGKPASKAKAASVLSWNLESINAPRVWNELGTRGENIVVGNIDSGAKFDHPALESQYRGRKANGTVDHNYSWFDPDRLCPTEAPCDDRSYGTGNLGVMVGGEALGFRVGVAPGAKWIAAKACDEVSRCGDSALLASAQWMLAPTDLGGHNPRPDLAPDIVSNSWQTQSWAPWWYQPLVEAWTTAGIFAVFPSGDLWDGGCGTTSGPGAEAANYSVGIYEQDGTISRLSQRGPGANGEIKPNLTAPGVSITTAAPDDTVLLTNGSAIASSHVAGTVALIWSRAPGLIGDIPATRALLDGTAIDVDDTRCGGTAADNNIAGEGRLDAYAAVRDAPVVPAGTLSGTVTGPTPPTDPTGRIGGVTVKVAGPVTRTTTTAGDGTWSLSRLPAGQYQVGVRHYGFRDSAVTATVVADQTATAHVVLTPSRTSIVSGTITVGGQPRAGAVVSVLGTSVFARTNANGRYQLQVAHGAHTLRTVSSSRCENTVYRPINVSGRLTDNAELPSRVDAFGYMCTPGPNNYLQGLEKVTPDSNFGVNITLPFPFTLYGQSHTTARVSSFGYINFASNYTIGLNTKLPSYQNPNGSLFAYWRYLSLDNRSGIYTGTYGTAPDRKYVVEWRSVHFLRDKTKRLSVSAVIGEDGTVGYHYRGIDHPDEAGASTTVGLENHNGTAGFEYSFNSPDALRNGQSLTFKLREPAG